MGRRVEEFTTRNVTNPGRLKDDLDSLSSEGGGYNPSLVPPPGSGRGLLDDRDCGPGFPSDLNSVPLLPEEPESGDTRRKGRVRATKITKEPVLVRVFRPGFGRPYGQGDQVPGPSSS